MGGPPNIFMAFLSSLSKVNDFLKYPPFEKLAMERKLNIMTGEMMIRCE